jgi:hypothetical protein
MFSRATSLDIALYATENPADCASDEKGAVRNRLLTFIGPRFRPPGRKSEVAAHERLSKRERFLTALDKFKKAMEGDDSPHTVEMTRSTPGK